MRVAFRADASMQIGNGHVMRCLTLADGLRAAGGTCLFICRQHVGHLVNMIEARGYRVVVLSTPRGSKFNRERIECTELPIHAPWLGTDWLSDAEQTRQVLDLDHPIDWLVVDHYALDIRWEQFLAGTYKRLMVIDDLADRSHDCDLLLDQTLGRHSEDYQPFVPKLCTILCGPQYALLRPEFAQWRPYSLTRRQKPELQHLLITMGGVDRDNATGTILDALTPGCLPDNCRISVVMGQNAPWLHQIHQQTRQLPWHTSVLVGVTNMARLMADSDLAVGAAGGTSWERCCLGLPTILMVLADNQVDIARALSEARAVSAIDFASCSDRLPDALRAFDNKKLFEVSRSAASVCDGTGSAEVIKQLKCFHSSCV